MSKLKPSDYWSTPADVFAWAEKRFGAFDLDVAANKFNRRCEHYIDESVNALTIDWRGINCWLNPPYSNVSPWLAKAKEQAEKGARVVALIKYDHTTKWWRDHVCPVTDSLETYPGVELVPYPKRIKFDVPLGLLGKDGTPMKPTTAPWPSVFVVFKPQ